MSYIFIHGTGQNESSWDKTVSLLQQPEQKSEQKSEQKAEEFDCPDLWSILNGREPTYTNLYRSFADFYRSLPHKINICGLSLGGIIALNYAIDYPEQVESMVLIAGQYKVPKTIMRLQNLIFRLMPQKAFEPMGMLKKDIIQLLSSMENLDFRAKLRDIPCKTLVVCGEKDKANKKAAADLARLIPDTEFKIIEGAGHVVNEEAPENLAEVLKCFWMR